MSEKRVIALGVTGGIAAYKAAELCSRLVKAGFEVQVLMTENAQEAADVRAVMDGEMRKLEGTSNHWNRPVE